VLVGKRTCFDGCGWSFGQVGGGTADRVQLDKVWFKDDPTERQEAGTPNVPGTIALGASIKLLQGVGMSYVMDHERALMTKALSALQTIPQLVIYGPLDARQRYAVVSFNLASVPHWLLASALNDYFAIAVRNGCFCAQPYVRQQLKDACDEKGQCDANRIEKKGMVRISFGLYSTPGNIDTLTAALRWIYENRAMLATQYDDKGKHKTFRPQPTFTL
jgi:selenocysteine lyase/cysteine desulfurase